MRNPAARFSGSGAGGHELTVAHSCPLRVAPGLACLSTETVGTSLCSARDLILKTSCTMLAPEDRRKLKLPSSAGGPGFLVSHGVRK